MSAARIDDSGTERPLTPVEAAQLGLVWRVARRIAHVQGGGSWNAFADQGPLEAPAPAATAASTALPPASSMRKPACAASGCEVLTTLRPNTAERADE